MHSRRIGAAIGGKVVRKPGESVQTGIKIRFLADHVINELFVQPVQDQDDDIFLS